MDDAPNTLILCADQLSPKAPGYAGHGMARTPHLDELAEGGTVFADAVCLSPICVPSRAAMATGRYVHEIGTWDNGHAYTGTEAPSWGHMLQSDREVTTIGKLHYRDESPHTGFPSQIVPMHAEGGVGDTFSLLRDDIQPRPELRTMVAGAHAGESTYLDYDEAVTNETTTWLRGHAVDPRPWTTFVSHVSPHHPLVAPPDIAATYPPDEVPLPYDWRLEDQPHHPALDRFRGYYGMSGEFSEAEVRRARATYLAMVTYLDDQIGRILEELTATGLDTRTHVIFTADHGDNVGDHGLWWKNNMYANSVGVPLILRGPGVEAGKVCRTPVSHLDVFATILELAGHPVPSWCRGRNLLTIASEPDDPTRLVFSEYHATGSSSGIFMVADSSYRLVEYVGEPSQLFDRRNDPDERHDLAGDPAYASVLAHYDRLLRQICNPEDVDRNAKSDQRAAIAALGGSEAVRALGYRTHVPVPGTT